MSVEETTFGWGAGAVTARWHHPEGHEGATVLLAHGAGGNLHMRPLGAAAAALCERGIGAVRFNFPYAEAGRRTPGRATEAIAFSRAVIEQAAGRAPGRLFAGGKSYGGRMASHAAAEGAPVSGLVFLGYPLHPPGKPEELRDAHLGAIEAPMLFLQGTRDPFARRDLLGAVVARLGEGATLHEIEGGDHSFAVAGRASAEVIAELTGAIAGWIGRVP